MPAARNIAFSHRSARCRKTPRRGSEGVYGAHPPEEADVIVARRRTDFMLQTLHGTQGIEAPVYGMNRGTGRVPDERLCRGEDPDRAARSRARKRR